MHGIGNKVATLLSRSSLHGRADFQKVKRNQCICDLSPDISMPIKNNTFIQVGSSVLCSTCQLNQLTPARKVIYCRYLRKEEGAAPMIIFFHLKKMQTMIQNP